MKFLKIFKLSEFKRVFKEEDSRFMLMTGLKVSGISFCINTFVYYFLYQIMRLNYAFFKANGFPDFIGETPFYESITMEALENLPVFFAFHVYLFFIGFYCGWIILRPFRNIDSYCEKVLENPDAIYKVDEFSNYKLLTRFSELFFEYLRDGRKKGELRPSEVPPQYSRIHQPVADKVFMLHIGLLLVIIAITSSVFIIENTSSIFESMVALGEKTLANRKIVNRFFSSQFFVMDEIVTLTVVLISFFYLLLGFHLYNKVSGAAFGIFSTMRAYMKGNRFSRVHLIGYAHVRENTRKLNKYLDYIQNNLSKDTSKG